jgi:epoxyqueuosine reductase
MQRETVEQVARECGFELAGVAPVGPIEDFGQYQAWVERGLAGEMRYLTDRRAALRENPAYLLEGARSVICVGKLYNAGSAARSGVSRYALGRDYHDTMREGLERMARRLRQMEPFDYKICVDTAPLLERSLARIAGLGWIGKNTCLINEPWGSWFFLGELITTLAISPGAPPPDRCGSCTRCIDACPTQALVPDGGRWVLDSRRCISYLTIELRGPIPEEHHAGIGELIFGCDICQEVCPWNSRAPVTEETDFAPRAIPTLNELAAMTEADFREFTRGTPLARPKYDGFRRNLKIAAANRSALDPLAANGGEHAIDT